ncbi:Uncharacterised protein [Vibrio cholerae]|nr:Uncharacterised protein [Vibrio cholerae]
MRRASLKSSTMSTLRPAMSFGGVARNLSPTGGEFGSSAMLRCAFTCRPCWRYRASS